jgi:hypothetical protein
MRGLALVNDYDVDVSAQMNYMKLKPIELVFVILPNPAYHTSIIKGRVLSPAFLSQTMWIGGPN